MTFHNTHTIQSDIHRTENASENTSQISILNNSKNNYYEGKGLN